MNDAELDKLIVDNMSLVHFIVRKYYPTYAKDEDIIQCGMVGLCKAARTWNSEKSTFSTYAGRCIKNEICMEFRNRMKHADEYSLDYEMQTDDGDSVPLSDLIMGDADVEYVDSGIQARVLTKRQKKIVDLRLQGLTPTEVAQQIGVSYRTVWRELRVIREKSKKDRLI